MRKFFVLMSALATATTTATTQQTNTQEEPSGKLSFEGLINTVDFNLDDIRELTTRSGVYASLTEEFASAKFVDANGEVDADVLHNPSWALLYYGAAFQPSYEVIKNWGLTPIERLIDEDKLEEAWQAGIEFLKTNPGSLSTYNNMINCGDKLGRSDDEIMPYYWRAIALSYVILRSGDERNVNAPFKVLDIGDEYGVLFRVMRADELVKQASVSNGDGKELDVMTVKWGDRQSDVWFDCTLTEARL